MYRNKHRTFRQSQKNAENRSNEYDSEHGELFLNWCECECSLSILLLISDELLTALLLRQHARL